MSTDIFQSDLAKSNSGIYAGYYNPYSGASLSGYYSAEYQQELYDNSVFGESLENFDTSETGALEQKVANFIAQIESGEEDFAMRAYNELLAELNKQSKYQGQLREDGDDSVVRAQALDLIHRYLSNRAGKDVDVEKWLKDNTSDVWERKQQLRCTFNDSIVDETTTEDFLQALTGREVRKANTDGYHLFDGCRAVGGFFASCWNGLVGREHM